MKDISLIRTKIHRATIKQSAAVCAARIAIRNKLVDSLYRAETIDDIIKIQSAIDVVEGMP